jgi:hypothetical protein
MQWCCGARKSTFCTKKWSQFRQAHCKVNKKEYYGAMLLYSKGNILQTCLLSWRLDGYIAQKIRISSDKSKETEHTMQNSELGKLQYLQKVTSIDLVRGMGWTKHWKLSVAGHPWVKVLFFHQVDILKISAFPLANGSTDDGLFNGLIIWLCTLHTNNSN